MTLLPRLAAILALLLLPRTFARAQTDATAFEKDLAELTRHPSRSVGTAGYYAAADVLEKQIAALPNVELKRHEFPIMAPLTQSATLDLGSGRVEPVHPFWPAHVRVNASPAEGIKGNLVYAGEGRYEQLKPASLRGQIAVVEASAGSRWMDASYMGARAILVLGSNEMSWFDLQSHDLRIPVNLPRFYIPPGKLADELRAGAHKAATLKATVAWQPKLARNYYALVRPARKQPDGWDFSQPPAALMFSVPFDASSLVPDLAPGASQAVQTAAGLALLRDLSKQPWDRPVVVAFTGGDAIQMLATRNMFSALGESPAIWRKEIAALEQRIADADRDLVRARAAAASPGTLKMPGDADLIGRVAKIIDTDLALELDQLFRARSVPVDQRTDEQKAALKSLEAQQIARNRLKAAFQQNPSSLASEALKKDADEYLARTIDRLGGGGETSDGLVKQLAARKAELETRISLYHWLADATGRPRDPAEKQTDARLIELLIGLDLSDRGTRVGPMFYGFYQRNSAMPLIQEFRDWFTRVQPDFPSIDFEPLRGARLPPTYLAAPLPIVTELAQAWGTPGVSMITLNDLRARRDTPADLPGAIDLTKITPQLDAVMKMFRRAAADKRFVGPTDIKRLNVALTGQVVSTAPGRPLPDLPRPGFLATYSYHIQLPSRIPLLGGIAPSLGVRRTEIEPCDAEGNYRFEGIPRLRADRLEGIEKLQADMQVVAVQMFRVDPRQGGAITGTSDLAQQVGDMKWWVDLRQQDVRPIRSLVFDCEEFSLTRLYDPRFLQTLSELMPLDARRGAEPKRFNFLLAHQMLAGFVEPGMPTDLLVRYGRVGNRLVLLNMPEKGGDAGAAREARGFTPSQLNDLGPLALVTAHDFSRLDDERLAEYRRAGVSAKILDDLHATAAAQITAADAALKADDGLGLIRNANGAWANEARVYHAAQAMARDVIRAAIFLLMLCVPFSFCMERLLIATPNVYKQIAGMAAIFLLMTGALWSFHPAFKISASPLIIILAFAIILMSCVVIFVVYNKFDAELTRMRARASTGMMTTTGGDENGVAVAGASGNAAAASGGPKASVLMSAILLGIANMRRRKFRTLLTSITIVLITFAVLCFTSTSTYVGASATPTGIAASHPGVQLRQRGFRPIPEILPDQLRAVLADPALKLGANPQVVERWWAVSTSEPNEQYNLTAGGAGAAAKTISLPAMLGLSPGESKLSKIAEVIGPGKLAALEQGDPNVIYLSDETAARLGGVKETDIVRLGGIDLTVAAVFPAKQFDDQVRTLSGDSLAPLKYVSGQLDAGGKKLDDNAAESLDVSGDSSESGAGYDFLSASDFAIVSKDVCRRLYKSTLRSVALRLDDDAQTQRVADELSKRFSLALFAGYTGKEAGLGVGGSGFGSEKANATEGTAAASALPLSPEARTPSPETRPSPGVFMVSAGTLSNASGAGAVAVPLLVAGLIIFNTMMGSIAERKKEIHVYTSLGLAPAHVGALFVAEALTYGLIGSVFGYVIGQGVGTLLLKLGWLGPVTLNYSGSSAMMTMLLILGIVLLSSLVPARLAAKIASPSIDRQWKIPEPQAGVITTALPFTINQTAADGVLAYLKEFFDDHREGAVGVFAAGPAEIFNSHRDPSAAATTSEAASASNAHASAARALHADTWLTPFDLGVRQRTEIHIEPGAFPEIFEVRVVLTRLSGDDGNFHRMNRPFLTELRKQFLRWRSLPPQAMQRYVTMSAATSRA